MAEDARGSSPRSESTLIPFTRGRDPESPAFPPLPMAEDDPSPPAPGPQGGDREPVPAALPSPPPALEALATSETRSGARRPLGIYVLAATLTSAWLVGAAAWIARAQGFDALLAGPLPDLAALVSAVFSPLALLWLLVLAFDRSLSAHREADMLRRYLSLLVYPADAAQGRVNTVADSLRAQARELSAVTRDAVAAAESIRGTLAGESRELVRVTQDLGGNTGEALNRVASELRSLHEQVDKLSTLSREAERALARQRDTLDLVASKAEKETATLGSTLARQCEAIKATAAEVENRATAVGSLVTRQEAALSAARDAADSLGRAAESLFGKAEAATDGLDRRVQVLEDAGARMARQAVGVAEEVRKAIDEMGALGQTLFTQGESLEQIHRRVGGSAREATQALGEALQDAGSDLNLFRALSVEALDATRAAATAIRDTTAAADTARHQLTTQATEMEGVARGLVRAVQDSSGELTGQADAITQTSEKAAERIRHASDMLSRNAVDITRTTARASAEIGAVSESLRDGVEAVNRATEDLRQVAGAADSGAETIARRITESAAVMHDATDALLTAGSTFRGEAERVSGAASDAVETISGIGARLREEAGGVTEAAEHAAEAIGLVQQGLARTAVGFEQAIGDAYTNASRQVDALRATMDQGAAAAMDRVRALQVDLIAAVATLAETVAAGIEKTTGSTRSLERFVDGAFGSLETRADTAGDRLGALSERLKLSAEVLEATAEHAASSLMDSTDRVHDRLEGLASQLAVVRRGIDEAATAVQAGSGAIDHAAAAAVARAHEASDALAVQVEAMAMIITEAEKRTKALDVVREKVDVQRFLTETSYVVERLQAAAVDITRLFTPAVEEDLWKRFYKGEQNAFLRHAARTITRAQTAAVKKTYQESREFRAYATRYMGEFEALLKAARANDRADVLTAIFTSSDMGRLYMVLARALGRNSGE